MRRFGLFLSLLGLLVVAITPNQLLAQATATPTVPATTETTEKPAANDEAESSQVIDKEFLQNAASAIDRYMAKPEPEYGWEYKETTTQGGVQIHQLELTSQTWQTITWKHSLTIYEPANIPIQDHMILFVSGGSDLKRPGLDEHLLAISIANLAGGRVALLKHVPNQPLFDGRKEDDLITETWLRYLETGDESWPLLFPMAKSAVKAMDAIGEFGKERKWEKPVEKFVITGASKRGWTSWLTPVVDKRIVATAPIVINTLHFPEQMKYQTETWGTFSEQIADYTSKGLISAKDVPETPRRAALLTMMDPWTYRTRLKLPKLIINGTNDRYWVVDAAHIYYEGLIGKKNILEIPNAGHSLNGGRTKAVASLAALFRATAAGKELPQVHWTEDVAEKDQQINLQALTLSSDHEVKQARLWSARSDTKDFRNAKWSSQTLAPTADGSFIAKPSQPTGPDDHHAVFGELEFIDKSISPPLTYTLTTYVIRYPSAESDNDETEEETASHTPRTADTPVSTP